MDKDEMAQLVAARIKSTRELKGFNQARLAAEANITPAAISQIESGERTPSTPVLRKIASVLKVSSDYLLGDSDQSEINDLLQDEKTLTFFRDFKNLSPDDQTQMKQMAEFLKSKQKK